MDSKFPADEGSLRDKPQERYAVLRDRMHPL